MTLQRVAMHPAGHAFDRVAASYDDAFTRTAIGQAQRKQVWPRLLAAFPPGSRILELNCGTGEDARFLAEQGRSVFACDASRAMIGVAQGRQCEDGQMPGRGKLEYAAIANENLASLRVERQFDGVFSNFSGLNCVTDLKSVAFALANLIKMNGRLLICVWSRLSAAELVWFMAHGQANKALRRLPGKAAARVGGVSISVNYPSVRKMRESFSPWFRLTTRRAVGLFVPPSYLEPVIRNHPKLLARLEAMDRFCAAWPCLRDVGDHTLLEFVRCRPLAQQRLK